MSSAKPQILLTGATGYIGGSILSHLMKANNEHLKSATITCLVRGDDRAAKLKDVYGSRVEPVLFKDLDDTERVIEVASQADIIINTLLGYHPSSAAALVQGLAKRKQQTGRDVWMIHTSGTSNLADQPITGAYKEDEPDRVFDDSKDDIYSYEKMRSEKQPYPQRISELGVIDEGVRSGVKTLVIMSPTIYGVGTGEFNRSSIQVPGYVKSTISNGQAVVVGDGKGVWDNVHVEDLAGLYEICLLNILEKHGNDLPIGERGIIFSGTGRHTWGELAQGVADAAYDAGRIGTKEVRSVSLEESVQLFKLDRLIMELGLSSNSRARAAIGSKLGWQPSRGKSDWKAGFAEEVRAAVQNETK